MYKIIFFTKKFIFPLLLGLIFVLLIGTVAAYFFLKSNTVFVKGLIEKELEARISYDVEIDSVEAQWHFTNPSIIVNGFKIHNKNYKKSIAADRMEFDFSWLSLVKFSPVIDRVQLDRPNINIVRDVNGLISINGIDFTMGNNNLGLSSWLLNQDDVIINEGQLSWQDLTRSNDILQLNDLNFSYGSSKLLSFIGRREFMVNSLINPGSDEHVGLNGFIDIRSIENYDDLEGYFNIKLNNFELAKLSPWFDYPANISTGIGDLSADVYLKDAQIVRVDGSTNLNNVTIKKDKFKALKINNLNSFFDVNYNNNLAQIYLNNLSFMVDGSSLESLNLKASFDSSDELNAITFDINETDLSSISQLSQYFPDNFNFLKEPMKRLSPTGKISNLKFNWEKGDNFFRGLELKMDVEKINLKPFNGYPGVKNLSAILNIANNEGFLQINSKDLVIIKNDIFRQPIKFDQIIGDLTWLDNRYEISNLKINNQDFVSNMQGAFITSDSGAGDIDLEINIPNADISRLSNYYPKSIGEEGLKWLDTSLLRGLASNTKIIIRGNMQDFPFVDKENKPDSLEGLFEVTSSITGSTIEYGKGWPNVENFDIDVMVTGSKIELVSKQGNILSNEIISFTGAIDDFTKEEPLLDIYLKTNSSLDKMLDAINNSPVKKVMKGTSHAMKGSGLGQLDLMLSIPLKDTEAIRYTGSYLFNESSMENQDIDLPLLSNIKGKLIFDDDGISLNNGRATLFDQPLEISIKNKNKAIVMNLSGTFDSKFLSTRLGDEWSNNIQGHTEWQGKLTLSDKESELFLSSNLNGLEINSMYDLNKGKDELIQFQLKKRTPESSIDYIDMTYGEIIKAKFIRESDNKIKRGFIGVNATPSMPDSGVVLNANLDFFDTKNIKFLFDQNNQNENINKKIPHKSLIDKVILNIDELMIKGNRITNAFINYIPTMDGSNTRIDSREVIGDISWSRSDKVYKLNFSKMHLMRKENDSKNIQSITEEDIKTEAELSAESNTVLSKIDMIVDSFKINENDYGKVILSAHEDYEGFIFDSLDIVNDAYILKGNGYWKSTVFPEKTSMNFEWDIKNVGNTLNNLGYPNLIEDGNASIIGLITWDDGPANFNAEDFYGNFTINTKKGTIKKIEPGVAGRLVGLVSLQNLPRRLTLDFSDLFQEGLPYKKVQSPKIIINKGVLSTKELNIKAPSANIRMEGIIDFVDETQDLHVIIEPKVSDTITAGALVGGPLAAAAAFIAQKILDDPFNKITTAEYHITGSWDDPQEKIVDTKVDNFIEDSIINPAGEVLDGVGGVINDFIIQPAEELNN
tara:strand:- start:12160 stop:16101 length:3942 start_codon:yes stop_codon:yes gene_type:complete